MTFSGSSDDALSTKVDFFLSFGGHPTASYNTQNQNQYRTNYAEYHTKKKRNQAKKLEKILLFSEITLRICYKHIPTLING